MARAVVGALLNGGIRRGEQQRLGALHHALRRQECEVAAEHVARLGPTEIGPGLLHVGPGVAGVREGAEEIAAELQLETVDGFHALRGAITPALLISTSIGAPSARSPSANRRTLARSARSIHRTSSDASSTSRRMSDAAAWPFCSLRTAMTTCAPAAESRRVASFGELRVHEAVLLELCTTATAAWLDELEPALAGVIGSGEPVSVRADRLAAALATSLAAHPVLCDLISAQAGVLEHNISTAAVRINIANVERLAEIVLRHLPEPGVGNAGTFTALAAMLTASVWTHSHPPPAVVAAYEADPSLARHRLDFTEALRDSLDVILAGLLARRD